MKTVILIIALFSDIYILLKTSITFIISTVFLILIVTIISNLEYILINRVRIHKNL